MTTKPATPTLQEIAITDLNAAAYNPRKMKREEFLNLVQSIREFGFAQPITINSDMTVIAGHQRLATAAECGMTHVPCFQICVSKTQEKILNVALNRISGQFDEDKLKVLLEGLENEELELTGLSDKDLAQLLAQDPDPEEKDAAFDVHPDKSEGHEYPQGSIFKLGDHRLMCGDSTNPDHVLQLLAGASADCVFTDPPYNVNYVGEGKETSDGIKNDNMTDAAFLDFCEKFFKVYHMAAKEGAPFYVCSGWSSYPVFKEAMSGAGFHFSGVIIWVKEAASMGWNDYRYRHEWLIKAEKKTTRKRGVPILYGWKRGKHYFRDSRDETDIWEVPRKSAAKYFHPTEKPLWLPMKAIQNSTRQGETVLDLFAGSGSTLIASHMCGRRGMAMELDPKFINVILNRWKNLTGKDAERIQ